MMFPERRVRAADPAHALPPQPDDRAEQDLASLLAGPVPDKVTVLLPGTPARRAPVLVTVLVAAMVIALTVAVVAGVRPRTAVATAPSPSSCATSGTTALLCGTYRSTRGTGDLAFLATQPYVLSFTREAGLTMLLESDCDTLHWTVTLDGSRFDTGTSGATLRACSPNARLRHQALVKYFDTPNIRWSIHTGALTFRFGSSGATAVFVRSVPTTRATLTPPYFTECHPADVLPFKCGTYRSTYGGKTITGDTGGPTKDPLELSFASQQGVLLLTAVTRRCLAAVIPVRYEGGRLRRAGEALYGQAAPCSHGNTDTKSWAYAFLNGPLAISNTSGPDFGAGNSSVFFQYIGAAGPGQKQPLPRDVLRCTALHCSVSGPSFLRQLRLHKWHRHTRFPR